MVRGRRERVVVVVPALAECEDGDQPVVAALVAGREGLRAERVADRVHGEHGVVVDGHAHDPAPEQPAPAVHQGRHGQPEREPEQRRPFDRHDDRVLHQPPAVPVAPGRADGEDPAHVGVQQAVEGAVRVARAVGVGVVLEVPRRPVDRAAGQGHRAGGERGRGDPGRGAEAAVREQAVVAERRPQAGDDGEDGEEGQVDGGERPLPEGPHRVCDAEQRAGHEGRDAGPNDGGRQAPFECLHGGERAEEGEDDGGGRHAGWRWARIATMPSASVIGPTRRWKTFSPRSSRRSNGWWTARPSAASAV